MRRWDPSTPDAVPDGFAKAFFAYCVDITQYLVDPQMVEVVSNTGFSNGVASGGAKAGWLFNEYANDIRNNPDGLSATELRGQDQLTNVPEPPSGLLAVLGCGLFLGFRGSAEGIA